MGGWMGLRTVLDAVVKRKIPSPRGESNRRTPIVQPLDQCYTDGAITTLTTTTTKTTIIMIITIIIIIIIQFINMMLRSTKVHLKQYIGAFKIKSKGKEVVPVLN
jgi:hypothetical protein